MALKKSGIRLIAALLGGVVSIILFSVFKFSSHGSDTKTKSTTLGRIEAVYGHVEHRPDGAVEFTRIPGAATLTSGERIMTATSSEAVMTFANGAAVRLKENSQAVAEPNATREGAVRLTVLDGDVEILNFGPPGGLQLIRDGRDVTSENETTDHLVIGRKILAVSASESAQAPVARKTITATTASETPTPQPMSRPNQESGDGDLTSLSNEEIRKSLRNQMGFFQRWYLVHLGKHGQPLEHEHVVTVGFLIQPTGKVSSAKIIRSDFQDATLNNCVIETIERTSFRPFNSSPIPVLEFPIELR